MEDRRAENHVLERVDVVLTGFAAAGEERLQRLGGELDHAVAVELPGPAALEVPVSRSEHAELHQPGSVWTTTSAMSGRSRRICSSMRLACACASARAVPLVRW